MSDCSTEPQPVVHPSPIRFSETSALRRTTVACGSPRRECWRASGVRLVAARYAGCWPWRQRVHWRTVSSSLRFPVAVLVSSGPLSSVECCHRLCRLLSLPAIRRRRLRSSPAWRSNLRSLQLLWRRWPRRCAIHGCTPGFTGRRMWSPVPLSVPELRCRRGGGGPYARKNLPSSADPLRRRSFRAARTC